MNDVPLLVAGMKITNKEEKDVLFGSKSARRFDAVSYIVREEVIIN